MLLPPASWWMASLILQTTRTDFAWGCSQTLTATPPLRTLGGILAKVRFGSLHLVLGGLVAGREGACPLDMTTWATCLKRS